jgi:hypothetical protein
VSVSQKDLCKRTTELIALGEMLRKKALCGELVDLDLVASIERLADQAVKAMNLPKFKVDENTLQSYLAGLAIAEDRGKG